MINFLEVQDDGGRNDEGAGKLWHYQRHRIMVAEENLKENDGKLTTKKATVVEHGYKRHQW